MTENVGSIVFWIGLAALAALAYWPRVATNFRYARLLLLLLMSCVAASFPIAFSAYLDKGWERYFWLTIAWLAMLFLAPHVTTKWRFGKAALGSGLCVLAIAWIVLAAVDPIISQLSKATMVVCGLCMTGQGISLLVPGSNSARKPSQWVNFRGGALVEQKGFRFPSGSARR